MRFPLGVLAVSLLLAIVGLPPPLAEAAVSTPVSFSIEPVKHWTNGLQTTLREVNWHPSGEYALIAGGTRGPSTDPTAGWSLLLKYENSTGKITEIFNQSGVMFFSVRFHPGGGHALVIGEKDAIYRYDDATGKMENLWTEFQSQYLLNNPTETKPPIFLARGLAYRPDGAFAVVTGGAMLAYEDGKGFSVLDSGNMKYYKAVAFAPDSSYGIVEGGDTDEEGHARIGQLWFLGMTKERCARYLKVPQASCLLKFGLPYGLFEPNRADPSDITFHPIVNASFVYGYDDTHGTILRLRDNGTDYVPEWMQAHHKSGKYTDMEFRPHGSRALVTALGNPQLMEFDGLSIRGLMNHTTCFEVHGRPCGELESVAWHPSGSYALAVGLYAAWYKITPTPDPELEVTEPTPAQTIVDEGATTVTVAGKALATEFGARIRRVSVSIDDGAWNDGNVTRFNPTQFWYRWNVSAVPIGEHIVRVQAEDDRGHVSSIVSITVYVQLPPPPLPAPVLAETNLTSRLGDFSFSWEPVPGALEYIVQDSLEADFAAKVTWPLDQPLFESFTRPKGVYYFRVRAEGAPRDPSEWSPTLIVNVTEGRQPRNTTGPPLDDDRPSGGDDVLAGNLTDPANGSDDPPPDPDTPPVDDGGDDGPDTPPATDGTPVPWALALLAGALAALAVRRRR